jgi:hypothetical protein
MAARALGSIAARANTTAASVSERCVCLRRNKHQATGFRISGSTQWWQSAGQGSEQDVTGRGQYRTSLCGELTRQGKHDRFQHVRIERESRGARRPRKQALQVLESYPAVRGTWRWSAAPPEALLRMPSWQLCCESHQFSIPY